MPAKDVQVDYDIIIVGGGISGINAAYRIQTELPNATYTILEGRGALGGTWDFFKYPGLRSDSDLHTFGFPWRPWKNPKAIAEADAILEYLRESASINGIDQHVLFNHKLKASNWSTEQQAWTVEVDNKGTKKFMRSKFVLLSTGYYDYEKPLQVEIPGLDKFQGKVIHPQHWPEDLDYAGKDMVIIGSGATAVTLLPVLAEKASHVTMLQRSPGYILSRPAIDPMGQTFHKYLPSWLAFVLVRWKFLLLPFAFFKFCRAYPKIAKDAIRKRTKAELPKGIPHDPHFSPNYNPWEQRLCICPDGDFYKALRAGKSSIVTDKIEKITEKSIVTRDGTVLNPDIIITATGLKLQIAGGAEIKVDGKPITISDKFLWKGLMLQDVPNLATVIGYTNASWTLGADATALAIVRIFKRMQEKNLTSVVPRIKPGQKLTPTNVLNLNSTYVEAGKAVLPKAALEGPFQPRSTYFTDYYVAKYGNMEDGLEYASA